MNDNIDIDKLKTNASIYVPDAKGNSQLKEFISWGDNKFTYSGNVQDLDWTNNLFDFGINAVISSSIGSTTSLENVPFCTWDGWGADAESTGIADCLWVVGEGNNNVYGDPSVINYADLTNYSKLIVVVSDGTPRFLFNRDVDEGIWNADESQSHLIEYPRNGWSSKYFSQDEKTKTYTVDLKQITKDKGYCHLHSIKGANWTAVSIISMELVKEYPSMQVGGTSVGEYADSVTFTFTYKKQSYDVKLPCQYSIVPAPLTAKVQNAQRVYGQENPKFKVEYTGFVNGETAAVVTKAGEFTTEATAKSDVGEYAINYNGAEAKNYMITAKAGKLTITPAVLTAKVKDESRTYGDENPQFTYTLTGLVNGDKEEDAITSQGTFATKATAKSDVGEYEVTLSGVEARNYTFEYEPGTLTVTKAPLTAEVQNTQRAYGADNPQFTAKYTGFVNGDTEAVLTNKGTFATEATKESPAGEYAITLTGVDAKNYEVTTIAGKLTIGIAKLTVKVNNAERMYGDENPAFTYTLTGLMNGDKEEDVLISTGTFTTKATAKSDVGEYEVTLSGVEAKNYTIEYEPGTLTVTKAPLTAEVQNAQRAYGADNPQFTAKYTGFVNGDTEAALTNLGTFATEATKESPAGEYAITLTGVDAKNYEVTTIAGKLTIGIAKLTVKVNNAERVYGNENPAFTYTLTGLMNGEKEEDVLISAGTFTTEATKMSDVGEYAVKCLDVKAKNYEVETIDGVLKVTPAQIIVRVNNATRPYGEENPQFTALYIGFRNNETDDVLTNNSVFSTSATKTSDVGEYEITATNAQAKNYTFEYEPGTLTIEQAEQQIVWDQELGDIAQFMQIELTATATSGLAVSYQVTQGSDVCSVVKVGKTTFLDCFGTGDVTLSAWQEGNKNYYPTLRTYKQVKVVPTGIGHVEAGDYTVITKRGQLLIGGLKDGDTVQVTDLAGRTVYSGEESTIYVTRGSYIVRIGHWMKKVLTK